MYLNFIDTFEIYSPEHDLENIFKNNLTSTLPNLDIVLQIVLILPASVASGERSFPSLNFTKKYLRTSMTQDRLNNLSLVSIDSDSCETLGIDDIIKEFARIKARNVNLITL